MSRLRIGATLVGLMFIHAPGASSQASKRPMTFADIMDLKGIGGVALSPDASVVAYAVSGWEHPNARPATDATKPDTARGSFRQMAELHVNSHSVSEANHRRRGHPTERHSRSCRRAEPVRM